MAMKEHILRATCETVHLGGFSENIPPVLRVESGDRIQIETYTGYYLIQEHHRAPQAFFPPELLNICHHLPPERKIGPGPHLLTGPIHIQNAQPGDILEIRLERITPSLPVGFNAIRAGWGALPQKFPHPALRFIPLDLDQQIAHFPGHPEIKIPLQPFFGILAVAPPSEPHSSVPPGTFGGNMDNRELQAGSRLFLPVQVPGALLSVGDGHGAQGDGEVNVTAIETSMNGTIQVILHQNFPLPVPLAQTPTDLITMGFAPTLDEALEQALEQMIQVLVYCGGLTPEEAYVLCSLAASFRITQVVNQPQKGVHGLFPLKMLPQGFQF